MVILCATFGPLSLVPVECHFKLLMIYDSNVAGGEAHQRNVQECVLGINLSQWRF